MTALQISILGSPEFLMDGVPLKGFLSNKVRAIMIYLAIEYPRPHQRQALAALFWPEHSATAAKTNLRRALSNLRKVINDDKNHFLEVTRQSLQLNSGANIYVDALEFDRLLADPNPNQIELEQASNLFKGRFLHGFSLADSIALDEWVL